MDASNLLKPALASGDLRCIGSTTYQEYKRSFDRDKALARRFQRIEVNEPTPRRSRADSQWAQEPLREASQCSLHRGPIRSAVELSARYINDRFLPDKAIDVMDEAGVARPSARQERRSGTVGARDSERTVARMAKIPERTVSSTDRARLQDLDTELKKSVYGQDTRSMRFAARSSSRDRPGTSRPPGWLVPFCRTYGRRQDRGRAATGQAIGRRVPALRHERIHGTPHGFTTDRRASGLRRLRSGRTAD